MLNFYTFFFAFNLSLTRSYSLFKGRSCEQRFNTFFSHIMLSWLFCHLNSWEFFRVTFFESLTDFKNLKELIKTILKIRSENL